MAPIIRDGTRSSSDAGPWTCKCGRENLPTKHLLLALPKFICDCGEKFTGDFNCSLNNIKVNERSLLGKVHLQGQKPHCVAYAFTHALQVKERLEALIKKQDPLLLIDLDPEKLFKMYKDKCPDMFLDNGTGKPCIRRRANVCVVQIALLLREVGLMDELNNIHKVGDVTVIPRDDFEGISRCLADGVALVGSFLSGKRLWNLKYRQIYKTYSASKYYNQKKHIVGHAVCLIGSGREGGIEYYDFLNSYRAFCARYNSRRQILKFGVGRLRASDLKSNVVRLCRVAESGDQQSLASQRGTILKKHNRHLMTALKHQVAAQLDLDKSDGEEVEDFDNYMKVPHDWTPAEIKPYTSGKWLTDEKARGQFVIHAGTFTEVHWNDARQAMPELAYQKQYWTNSFIQWSPLGTHLATVHRQGAQVWGGDDKFVRLMRFAHPQVKLIDFSPGERYLVTYSSHEPSNPSDTHSVVLNIFDVRTGKAMRDFKGSADEFTTGGSIGVSGISWPIFRWGGGRDDKYFAKLGKNVVSVYETETFSLLDKKSLKVDNVVDFSWSPTDPILSLFVPELGGGNQPATVSLVQIPGKEELRQKNLFSVSDCKMYWQSNGEYLAVQVDRYTKNKKSTYTGFELFRIKERDIPIEVFELDNKNDKIIAFAWEPRGHRFAIIHGDGPKPDISFYSMRTANNVSHVSKLTTLKAKQADALFWSPAGRFIVLAGLKGFNGQVEFYNVDDLETMVTAQHFMATDIMWDPTGRFVATAVTSVHEMENGFQIWSFNGEQIYKVSKDRFHQFHWRPRPLTVATLEKEEEISAEGRTRGAGAQEARGGATMQIQDGADGRRGRMSIKLRRFWWRW